MRAARFAVPGDLGAPTGGYEYARQMLRHVPGLAHLALPDGFPLPSDAALRDTANCLAAVPNDVVLLVDGLAFGALPAWCLTGVTAPIVALVHHPLCLEAGILPDQAALLHASERDALKFACRVIATSAVTTRWLTTEFGIPTDRLSAAEPGTEPRIRATGSRQGALHLLAVGAITPRKGYDVLVQALLGLTHRAWHLTIAGDLTRNPTCVADLRATIARHHLNDRISLAGAVSDSALDWLYAASDLFISASHHEGYGMAVATAMAHGLPLVATNAGALAETIPPGASLTCPPGDAVTLRQAIEAMLINPDLRRNCAEVSWRAGQNLAGWQQTADHVAAVLASV